jgi:predicted transcriptional regulator
MDRGGLSILSDWLEQHPETRLVIIDTLNKIRPPKKRGADSYSEDYDALGEIQQFAMERGIAIMVIHHTRKSIGEYEIDEVAGTTGVSAAADSILMMRKSLNGDVLYATGRDVDTQELAIRFDKRDCQWEILGDAAEFAISKERQAIIEVLRESETPLTSKDIADSLNQKAGNVRFLLSQLARDGIIIRQSRGKYTIEKVTNNTNTTIVTNNANKLTNETLLAVVSDDNFTTNNQQTSQSVDSEAFVSDVSDVSDDDTQIEKVDEPEGEKNTQNAYEVNSDAESGDNIPKVKFVSEGDSIANKDLLVEKTIVANNGNIGNNQSIVTNVTEPENNGNNQEPRQDVDLDPDCYFVTDVPDENSIKTVEKNIEGDLNVDKPNPDVVSDISETSENKKEFSNGVKDDEIVTEKKDCGNNSEVTSMLPPEKIGNISNNNFTTEKDKHPLTDRLNEYLPRCPESFAKYIRKNLYENKLTLARAVEASSRMAHNDTAGAWRVLRI